MVACVRRELQHEKDEQFCVIFLDRKNQLILDEIIGRGTLDPAPVYARQIARRAPELQASSLILVHNHPAGDPKPWRADIGITGEIIDVPWLFEPTVHGHLVFRTSGLIKG
nr:JAB domain-containing protein [Hyphomonas sp.]